MTKKSISRLLQATLMCCLTVLFTACDDIFASEDNPTPAYLSMSEAPVTLKAGDTFKRKAISVTTAVVEYTSSDTNVATVDNSGLVTAIAEGEATITATATGYSSQTGKKIFLADSKSYKLTVKPATLPAAIITTAPVATTGDIAAGSATALVTEGVADGGTMMYEVTATNTKPTTTDGFSATVPTAATLADGTYYVWYYAKGDATHSDSEIAATAIEVTVTEVYAANEYNKGSWDSTNEKVVFTKQTTESVTAVANSAAGDTWDAGWYTVSGNVTITGNVTLTADAHLILQDGATLTINGKIDCTTNGKNLYIYGQKKGDGKLIVTNSNDSGLHGSASKFIEIHGGEITATTKYNAIYAKGIKVYGGKITATATGNSSGIVFGNGFDVYGGEIEATNTSTSMAFHGFSNGFSAPLTVYGGKVTATGNANGSGFRCFVKSGTSGIKFYFSDNGTDWDAGTSYASATQVGAAGATKKRYAKAE